MNMFTPLEALSIIEADILEAAYALAGYPVEVISDKDYGQLPIQESTLRYRVQTILGELNPGPLEFALVPYGDEDHSIAQEALYNSDAYWAANDRAAAMMEAIPLIHAQPIALSVSTLNLDDDIPF